MTSQKPETEKKNAAKSATDLVEDGMIVGLGTGSTAAYAIERLGRRIRNENISIMGVPTSIQSKTLADEAKIPLTTLMENSEIDIAIDGADQVDSELNLIKGGGGAHLMEKIVASSAKRFIVIVDSSKVVDKLNMPVPLEIVEDAETLVEKQVRTLNGEPMLRLNNNQKKIFITDNGNPIIDVDFGEISNPRELASKLSNITGSLAHGIFTIPCEVHVGEDEEISILRH